MIQTTQGPVTKGGTKRQDPIANKEKIMSDWISEMAGIAGIGRIGLDLSLSDVSLLVPDARVLWIAAAAVAFCIVAGCQELRSSDQQDQESDAHRK